MAHYARARSVSIGAVVAVVSVVTLGPKAPSAQAASSAASIDWRNSGDVTPVKNQGMCGSSWAFAATGAIESAYAIENHVAPVPLSEQQFVDCAGPFGVGGCDYDAGLVDNAFGYAMAASSVESEYEYPYTGTGPNACKYSASSASVSITGYRDVIANELSLQSAVAQQPVAAMIAVDDSFQFYSGGIIRADQCGNTLNHWVLVVGYGTEGGTDYWIVKNSWGSDWGEKGYARIARGRGGAGACGIATVPSYPIGAHKSG